MKRIGYHGEVGALVIVGSNVFPPGTLTLVEADGDYLEVWSLAQRVELKVTWQEVMALDGMTFAVRADAIAYLRSEFDKKPGRGDAHVVPVQIATVGQTVLPLPAPPLSFETLRCEVNGVVYRMPDIAVSEIAVTWANPTFSLDPSDRVTVAYS